MFGFTNNGFLRGRFTDFYDKFRTAIEAGDAFKRRDANGTIIATDTVLSDPDTYAGTPLVELATLYAGTNSDVHEAFEAMAQNLDPRDAEGKWLRALFVLSGLTPPTGLSDAQLRAILNSPAASKARSGRGGIEAGVRAITGVRCARLARSTISNPVPGIETPGAAVAVLADDIAAIQDQVAQVIWNQSGVGLFTWRGDTEGRATDAEGLCHDIRFYAGCRILLGVDLEVTIENCAEQTAADIPSLLTTEFRANHKCSERVTPADIIKLLCKYPGISVHAVKLGRRAPELIVPDNNGEYPGATMVMLDDSTTAIPWAIAPFCDPCNGEVWCDLEENCAVELEFFEFFDMAEQLVNVTVREATTC